MAQGQLSGGGGNATKVGPSTPDAGARLKDGEEARVKAWRVEQLELAGFDKVKADLLSTDMRALDLVRRGCPISLVEHLV